MLIQNEQIAQLVDHNGPHFDYWRRRCAQAFGFALLDEHHASP